MTTSHAGTRTKRPLPFVLRVAAEWSAFKEHPDAGDGVIFFQRRMALTGDLALTKKGADVQFSDLGADG